MKRQENVIWWQERPIPVTIEAEAITGEIQVQRAMVDFIEGRKAELEETMGLFRIPDRKEVAAFLGEYPALLEPLRKSVPHIRREFGQTDLSLEVFHDPESGSRDLLIHIGTKLPTEDALNRMERFDDAFTSTLPVETNMLLTFLLR